MRKMSSKFNSSYDILEKPHFYVTNSEYQSLHMTGGEREALL